MSSPSSAAPLRLAFTSSGGGGADTFVRHSARWLAEHGHVVHVLYAQQVPGWGFQHANLHLHAVLTPTLPVGYYAGRVLARLGIHDTPLPWWLDNARASHAMGMALQRIRARHGLDFVELFESYAPVRALRGLPYSVRLHGARWAFQLACEDGPAWRAEVRRQRALMDGARAVFAPSRAVAALVCGTTRFPASRVTLLRYPQPLPGGPLPAPPDGPPFHLMQIGRLERRKGVHLAVAALDQVWQTFPDTHLHLYGKDGDFGRAAIDAVLPPERHQGRLHVHDFVPHDVLLQRLAQAHLLLAPTRYETLGYTIAEAMAYSRPVVAADAGAVAELVIPNRTGWLAPRDDADGLARAIVTALAAPQQRAAYGAAGRAHVAALCDSALVLPQQVALYKAAIAGAVPPTTDLVG